MGEVIESIVLRVAFPQRKFPMAAAAKTGMRVFASSLTRFILDTWIEGAQ